MTLGIFPMLSWTTTGEIPWPNVPYSRTFSTAGLDADGMFWSFKLPKFELFIVLDREPYGLHNKTNNKHNKINTTLLADNKTHDDITN